MNHYTAERGHAVLPLLLPDYSESFELRHKLLGIRFCQLAADVNDEHSPSAFFIGAQNGNGGLYWSSKSCGSPTSPSSERRSTSGQGRRGVDMGPSALRVANLNERLASLGYDGGRPRQCSRWSRPKPAGGRRAAPSTCRRSPRPASGWPRWWSEALSRGSVPLVLGGDHSVAVGTVSGVSRYFRERKPESRPDLAGRARRHEHAGDQPQRQCPRHAAGLLRGAGPAGTGWTVRLSPQGGSANTVIVGLRDVDLTGDGRTCANPACAPSPCATSTSAACAR